MNVSREQLQAAAVRAGLDPQAAERLWRQLQDESAGEARPRFDTAHVAYYLGAMIVIGAMGWLMGNAWESFGGGGILTIAVSYAVLFYLAGRRMWMLPGGTVPGGLLLTLAVGMTPLALYGLSRWTGYWPAGDPGPYEQFHPRINASWVIMEIGTVLAALAMLRRHGFAFLAAPIALALWYLAMDLTDWMLGLNSGWEERQFITMIFGLVLLAGAYLTDLASRGPDYAFWLYLCGVGAFWGALTSMHSDSELAKFGYCLINVCLMVVSLVLRRRVFIIFGAVGFFGYLGHLAHRVFQDSAFFPFALTALGLAVITAGVGYRRYQGVLEAKLGRPLAAVAGHWLPRRARHGEA